MKRALMFSRRGDSGTILLEVLIGSSVLFVSLAAIAAVLVAAFTAGARSLEELQSAYLLEEGVEAVRHLRDNGWSGNIAPLTPGATYYLSWNGTRFVATATPEVVGGAFTRSVVIFETYRDSANDLADSGTFDPNTRRVTVTVTPIGKRDVSRSLATYLTNVFGD